MWSLLLGRIASGFWCSNQSGSHSGIMDREPVFFWLWSFVVSTTVRYFSVFLLIIEISQTVWVWGSRHLALALDKDYSSKFSDNRLTEHSSRMEYEVDWLWDGPRGLGVSGWVMEEELWGLGLIPCPLFVCHCSPILLTPVWTEQFCSTTCSHHDAPALGPADHGLSLLQWNRILLLEVEGVRSCVTMMRKFTNTKINLKFSH